MQIPYQQLSSAALKAVIQEFVTRDGSDHSSIEDRTAKVLKQLETGRAELHFDEQSGTCNIIAGSQ